MATTEASSPSVKVDDGGNHVHCCHGHGGDARSRFSSVVGAAVFADRVETERRAEFRSQMFDIRSEIRDLMGEVEGGQLSPEQQGTFDELVGRIVDLRETFGFRGWRNADAEAISARILDRFGVEPAPEGANGTADPNSVGALQDQLAKLTELVASLHETLESLTEKLESMQGATADETPPADDTESTTVAALVEETTVIGTETQTTPNTKPADEIAAAETVTETEDVAESDEATDRTDGDSIPDVAELAENLASVIANASTMMDDLLEALAA